MGLFRPSRGTASQAVSETRLCRSRDAVSYGVASTVRLGVFFVLLLGADSSGYAQDASDLFSLVFWREPLSSDARPVDSRAALARDAAIDPGRPGGPPGDARGRDRAPSKV